MLAKPIIMKFGGTSVEDREAFRNVAHIVKSAARQRVAVVVSAIGRLTNDLLASVKKAIGVRAVLASGAGITGSTPVFDLVREQVYRRSGDAPLEIPAGAVVVPGARAVQSEKGREWGLSLYAPVIVKYRDERTDAATQLEDLLR